MNSRFLGMYVNFDDKRPKQKKEFFTYKGKTLVALTVATYELETKKTYKLAYDAETLKNDGIATGYTVYIDNMGNVVEIKQRGTLRPALFKK